MIFKGLGCASCRGTCEEGLEGILGDLGSLGISINELSTEIGNAEIEQANATAIGDTAGANAAYAKAQALQAQMNSIYASSTPPALQATVSSVLSAMAPTMPVGYSVPATPANSNGVPILDSSSATSQVTSLMNQTIGGVPYWLIGAGVLAVLFLKGKE